MVELWVELRLELGVYGKAMGRAKARAGGIW